MVGLATPHSSTRHLPLTLARHDTSTRRHTGTRKYSLRKMRRYIYVAFAIVSAMMTPPDPYTMLGLWFPLVLLFEFGILAVAVIVHPYLARKHGATENEVVKSDE